MAIELLCGNCHGRLLVETPGSVVACPHCGVHLQTAPMTANSSAPEGTSTAPVTDEETTVVDGVVAPSGGKSDVPDFLQGPGYIDLDATRVDGGAAVPADDEAPAWLAADAEPPSAWHRADEPPPFLAGPLDAPAPPVDLAGVLPRSDQSIESPSPAATTTAAEPPAGAGSSPRTAAAGAGDSDSATLSVAPNGGVPVTARPAPGSGTGAAGLSAAGKGAGASPLAFKLLISYASAVTVACLYLHIC